MLSRVAIAGHPIHPALVPLPIGLAVATLAADTVYLSGGRDDFWYDVAFWAGWATVITGLLAALPGFGDFFLVASKTDARNPALLHMLLNVTFLAAFGAAGLLMLDDNAKDGAALATTVILHAVALGVLSLSGWIGGELSYRHHVGVVPDDRAMEASERSHHVR